jgi:[ribosomal protein S18]-alanine N-acetyltransferase
LNIIIRTYEPKDKLACLAAFKSNVPQYFTYDEVNKFDEWLDNMGTANYYVLEIEGKIAGCGGFAYTASDNEVRFTWGLVDKQFHKKGLGKQLFGYRIEKIKELYPNAPIALDTTQHSYLFFEKLGFKVEKITENFYAPGMDRYDMKFI